MTEQTTQPQELSGKTLYTDMDIHFTLGEVSVYALNIVYEQFTRSIPPHRHGEGCFEIHLIPGGVGRLQAGENYYNVSAGSLFVTGPGITHSQVPSASDPMQEYCVYLRLKNPGKEHRISSLMTAFWQTPFWIGRDTQNVHGLMRQLFYELEQKKTGYRDQVEMLLAQIIIAMVRSYESDRAPEVPFAPGNLADSKSVIVDEYFLYEYKDLSLEELAKRLKLSTRQTQRFLQKHWGQNFQEKKNETRMTMAAFLLADKNRSVSSIADLLGYSSPEHFSNCFRKYYGTSPSEYRK